MRKIIPLFALILIFNCGCTKHSGPYKIQNSFKEWTLFKKGSYWIYLNEKSGAIDTTYVYEDEKINYNPDSPPQYEYIYMNLSSTLIMNYVIYRGHNDNTFLRVKLNNNTNIDSDVLSESVAQGRSNKVSDHCRLITMNNTLSENGNFFSDVIQTQDSSTHSGNPVITNFYFVKNIGLVRMETKYANSDTVWSLLKWHVIQENY